MDYSLCLLLVLSSLSCVSLGQFPSAQTWVSSSLMTSSSLIAAVSSYFLLVVDVVALMYKFWFVCLFVCAAVLLEVRAFRCHVMIMMLYDFHRTFNLTSVLFKASPFSVQVTAEMPFFRPTPPFFLTSSHNFDSNYFILIWNQQMRHCEAELSIDLLFGSTLVPHKFPRLMVLRDAIFFYDLA